MALQTLYSVSNPPSPPSLGPCPDLSASLVPLVRYTARVDTDVDRPVDQGKETVCKKNR
ncbi:Hypothetical predicted protein, partial [Marmota monax]